MDCIVVHGTCVALGGAAALLRGKSGTGKSDLALRFMFLPKDTLGAQPRLVADDGARLHLTDAGIRVTCPDTITGKIEVRTLGIANLPPPWIEGDAHLRLLVDLAASSELPRFPDTIEWEDVLGVRIRRIALDPFELSAPMKLALAMLGRFEGDGG
ncbi:aldolase [Rhodomicrobium vannielii ATCC 17100]|uniref:HPr kinase/phosphorylase n=1 Tax=Rhodomicrobium vannielii TaxID=1069 RepID=UPI00191A7788|nr:aldolase [Rhodomicrobium vannielii]MBJ7533340.1 aldolase [Rhodomicrobium vannielii ATCC 17100]